jgi:hypothetical protein
MQWSRQILSFYSRLALPDIPSGCEFLYPFDDRPVQQAMKAFYQKYYADSNARTLLIGINPGRYGGGVTGIPFTDPIRLKENCGISHPFAMRQEISSVFVYKVIEALGGPELFFGHFYLTAISPVGFLRQHKNLNYYDDRRLLEAVLPFASHCMQQQLSWPVNRTACVCIGEGRNHQILTQLNNSHHWFNHIHALPHPRFVMQYRLKKLDEYVYTYVSLLRQLMLA